MAARGYTSLANVTSFLGQSQLSTQQQNEVTRILPAVEDYIDQWTRRTWIQPQIVAEQYDLLRDWVYLRVTPVVSVDLVKVRTRAVGDPGTTLTANVDYELQDTQTGLVVLTSGYGDPGLDLAMDMFTDNNNDPGPRPELSTGEAYNIPRTFALITYTPGAPVPSFIAQAATMLAAHWIRYNINPTSWGVMSQRDGDRSRVWQACAPMDVQEILNRNILTVIG